MIANATFNYIKEWISSHSLDSINSLWTILGSILTIVLFVWKYGSSYYQKINNYIHNRRTTKFYKVINSIEFLLWSNDVLERIYQKDFFTNIFGLKYPAFFIPCNHPYKYSDFKQVYNKDEIPFEEFPIIDNETLVSTKKN